MRLAAWLITLYRRTLSGRIPNVRCSFAAEESCSAFGLRVAHSGRNVIGRIARRLRRCRDACLLGDGRSISWTPLHDRAPADIVDEMQRDGESDGAIARMLQTRRAVARYRGDHAAFTACAMALPGPARVCSLPLVVRRARRRLAVLVTLTLAAIALTFVEPWLGALAAALTAAALVSARTLRSRLHRFDLHRGKSGSIGIARPASARPTKYTIDATPQARPTTTPASTMPRHG